MNWNFYLISLYGFSLYLATSIAGSHLSGEGIRGGHFADEDSFKYQVSIRIGNQHICGGSILTDRYILTAAHCVIKIDGEPFGYPLKVMAGTKNLRAPSNTMVTVDVRRAIVLKEYRQENEDDAAIADIAVLELKHDLGILSNVNLETVDLPKINEEYVGVEAVVSGYGFESIDLYMDPWTEKKVEGNGKSSRRLRFAKALVLSQAECEKKSKDLITLRHICASIKQSNPKKTEGVCSGDSGGPLVYNNLLIGVISSSPLGCREDKEPAVYSRVSSYIQFIVNALIGNITDDMRTIDF